MFLGIACWTQHEMGEGCGSYDREGAPSRNPLGDCATYRLVMITSRREVQPGRLCDSLPVETEC